MVWFLLACSATAPSDWSSMPIADGQIEAAGSEVLWVSYPPERELEPLTRAYRRALLELGWDCDEPRIVDGHGWASDCAVEGRPHKLLSASKLPQKVLVGVNNAHPRHEKSNQTTQQR